MYSFKSEQLEVTVLSDVDDRGTILLQAVNTQLSDVDVRIYLEQLNQPSMEECFDVHALFRVHFEIAERGSKQLQQHEVEDCGCFAEAIECFAEKCRSWNEV